MDKLSLLIINSNIEYEFLEFLQKFCKVKISNETKFYKHLATRLLKNIKISQPLLQLSKTKFTELPFWLFNNQSSTKYRMVKTINGYPFDIIKSGMQKYSRRGMPSECIYTMTEMYFFKWLDGGKSSFTNFYNRIRVILLEDVGISSPHAIPIANRLLEKIKKSETFPTELAELSWLLSNSLHYRMYSMVRSYYYTYKPSHKTPKIQYPLVNDELFLNDVNSLVYCLENKDPSCYWWMSNIVSSEIKLNTKCYKSTKSGFLGFSVLEWFFKKQKNIHKLIWDNFNICLEWYKDLKVKESAICPFQPMYMYILSDKLDFEQKIYTYNNNSTYYVPNLLNKKKEFIEAVYDMHTSVGRKAGKDTVDFAGEGSLVAFEDMTIDFPVARLEYVTAKINSGIVPKESDIFKLKSRAQLTCSMSRPDVYFAEMNGKNVVVKGPYASYDQANKTFQVSRLLSLFEEVNILQTNIRILLPSMFENVPVGCRRNIIENTPYYFLIFEDLYNLPQYPTKIKSSKLWKDEKVIDFDKLFKEHNFSFANPSEMSEKAKLSLLYQLAIRYTFELGDFAARNFTRVGDKVWNLDIEGMFIGKSLRWKKSEIQILANTYDTHKNKITNVLRNWLNSSGTDVNTSFYNRWYMVERVMNLSKKQIEQSRENLTKLVTDYKKYLLN
jgi:hypothetical protein